jgi:diguanylate cyclase (GGDEF)-like protein
MVDRGKLELSRADQGPEDRAQANWSISKSTIEQQIQHQAFHDPLTDLPNRLLLMNRLSRGLTGDGPRFAVLFIDLDGFKAVNDEFGHRTGDQVLIEAARRIQNELDEADLLARLGGDEFVVLLYGVQDLDTARRIAGRIISALAAPLPGLATPVSLAASVGVALAKPGAESPSEVLHRADGAMYAAKRSGRGQAAVAAEDVVKSDVAYQVAG